MAKGTVGKKTQSAATSRAVLRTETGVTTVTFGKVSVEVRKPSVQDVKKRLTESRGLVARLGTAIAKPGVRVNMKKTTPVYTVDTTDPTLVIQTIGKHKTRGRFTNKGVFEEVAA